MSGFQLARAANDDLADILAFIAEDNLDAAEAFNGRLLRSFQRLA